MAEGGTRFNEAKTDDVPAYVIGEFMVDKKPGEAVSLECPYCSGEMFEAFKLYKLPSEDFVMELFIPI
ncbi:hypothetical protein [Lysinibacillus sp. fls2-241-R2A-57]|uniref:hypothetical protein n=1 Tax=Lysinibacillus sp. fls2-241-R2A-57 TaxID=3040292 RepID=UPI00255346B8|nr:hypothetical protein [Lysinibacillus sp. fls2-241-R2A-57]